MFIARPPQILKKLYPNSIWRKDESKKKVYLTFDDGPIPEVTPWVLDLLDQYKIKATFFCVGDNVRKHTDVYQEVIRRRHRVGNHTFNHIQSFKYSKKEYLNNVIKAEAWIKSSLFRPPHGQLLPGLSTKLQENYRVIMWDLLTGDYDSKTPETRVLKRVKDNVRNGSIIVFHDSLKAEKNLRYALPRSIEYMLSEGYEFGKL